MTGQHAFAAMAAALVKPLAAPFAPHWLLRAPAPRVQSARRDTAWLTRTTR